MAWSTTFSRALGRSGLKVEGGVASVVVAATTMAVKLIPVKGCLPEYKVCAVKVEKAA